MNQAMRRRLIALAVLIPGAACSGSAREGASAQESRLSTVLDQACGDLAADVSFADTTERRALAATGGSVVRTGCRLTFSGPRGAELELDDMPGEGAGVMLHRYRGYLPAIGAHLVEVRYYEGGTHRLVYPGGALVGIAGPPEASPDRRRFASWSMDLVAEYNPNVLQLWRRTPGAARLEIAIGSEDWGPSDVRWANDTTVEFTQNFPTEEPGQNVQRRGRVQLRNGQWIAELHAR